MIVDSRVLMPLRPGMHRSSETTSKSGSFPMRSRASLPDFAVTTSHRGASMCFMVSVIMMICYLE